MLPSLQKSFPVQREGIYISPMSGVKIAHVAFQCRPFAARLSPMLPYGKRQGRAACVEVFSGGRGA